MAEYKSRIERLDEIVRLIPLKKQAKECPDPAYLLEKMGAHYAKHATPESRSRAIQRDLVELIKDQRIQVVNPGGKPLRYCRVKGDATPDPYVWKYELEALRAVIKDAWPAGRLDKVWQHVLNEDNDLGLGEDKLRIVTDTLRLYPVAIGEGVLECVLEALALSRTLSAGYTDAQGTKTRPLLHPQALLQRGPRLYLYALKDAEAQPLRMYALHRFTTIAVTSDPARQAGNFDLQTLIDRGQADFGGGEMIDIALRARGYVAELLKDCPLSAKQDWKDEDVGSDFEIKVSASIPATGQLFRWLLGCGDKIEVLEPPALRQTIAAQSAKTAALYWQDSDA
jgi:predicted DNA-binding transcriptional regulator YafY